MLGSEYGEAHITGWFLSMCAPSSLDEGRTGVKFGAAVGNEYGDAQLNEWERDELWEKINGVPNVVDIVVFFLSRFA